MITEINRREKKKYLFIMIILVILLVILVLYSIMVGQYEMSIIDVFKAVSNICFGTEYAINPTAEKVIMLIRFPRTVAAFIVGSCLSLSGSVFQRLR